MWFPGTIPWNSPGRAGASRTRRTGRRPCGGIPLLLEGFDGSQVAGIGAGGQMHGLVVLDEEDRVIRPAILWNDGRTAKQVTDLNETVGRDRLSQWTANIAFAGFTARSFCGCGAGAGAVCQNQKGDASQGLHQLPP